MFDHRFPDRYLGGLFKNNREATYNNLLSETYRLIITGNTSNFEVTISHFSNSIMLELRDLVKISEK
uniref:Uncharacterized protein n=1 Tax=Magnetococcus massalia (strain MO-1) TaxID=451514 RepID=A0A1S7LMZ6_MAGMO|nr:protein of unknown function [Candidatus Magnetococcus massalia]